MWGVGMTSVARVFATVPHGTVSMSGAVNRSGHFNPNVLLRVSVKCHDQVQYEGGKWKVINESTNLTRITGACIKVVDQDAGGP